MSFELRSRHRYSLCQQADNHYSGCSPGLIPRHGSSVGGQVHAQGASAARRMPLPPAPKWTWRPRPRTRRFPRCLSPSLPVFSLQSPRVYQPSSSCRKFAEIFVKLCVRGIYVEFYVWGYCTVLYCIACGVYFSSI